MSGITIPRLNKQPSAPNLRACRIPSTTEEQTNQRVPSLALSTNLDWELRHGRSRRLAAWGGHIALSLGKDEPRRHQKPEASSKPYRPWDELEQAQQVKTQGQCPSSSDPEVKRWSGSFHSRTRTGGRACPIVPNLTSTTQRTEHEDSTFRKDYDTKTPLLSGPASWSRGFPHRSGCAEAWAAKTPSREDDDALRRRRASVGLTGRVFTRCCQSRTPKICAKMG